MPHVVLPGPADRRAGTLAALEALALVAAEGHAFRATLCGDGPDGAAAANLRRRLGLRRAIGVAPADSPAFSDPDVVLGAPEEPAVAAAVAAGARLVTTPGLEPAAIARAVLAALARGHR